MTRGNDKGTRHIKHLVSLYLLCPLWVQKKQVHIWHSGKVTTKAEDWYSEIPSGPSTILSEAAICSFSSISVCWFLFGFFFLAATLAVTNSVRNKASKNVSFSLFYWFGQTILVFKCFRHHIQNCNFCFSFPLTFCVKPITNSLWCFEDKTAVMTLEEHDIHIILLTIYDVTSCICPLLLILNLYSPSKSWKCFSNICYSMIKQI